MIMNFESDGIEEYESLVVEFDRGKCRFKAKKLELDMKHRKSQPAKPSIEEVPKLELKALLPHLRYVFLGRHDTLSIIIESDLIMSQVECLVEMLKRLKRAIGCNIADISGSHPVVVHTK